MKSWMLTVTAALALAGTVSGQAVREIEPEGEPPREPIAPDQGPRIAPEQRTSFIVTTGGMFNSANGDGRAGELLTFRAPLEIRVSHPVDEKNRLTFSLNQTSSFYDFEEFTGFNRFQVQDPLDYGIEAAASVGLIHQIDQRWFASGVFRAGFSGELGADFGDSMTYSLFGGVRHIVSKDLSVGIGLAVQTRLEQDPIVFPLPTVDWQVTHYWSLHLGTVDAGPGAATVGVRAEYEITDDLDAGLFAGMRFHQFRLARDNRVQSAGILEDITLPIGAYARYRPTPRAELFANVHLMAYRELKLYNTNGVPNEDIELQPTVGLGVGVQFRL